MDTPNGVSVGPSLGWGVMADSTAVYVVLSGPAFSLSNTNRSLAAFARADSATFSSAESDGDGEGTRGRGDEDCEETRGAVRTVGPLADFVDASTCVSGRANAVDGSGRW